MSGTIDNLIFNEMKNIFYETVANNGIDLSTLPSYNPLKVISSMFLIIEQGGTEQSWQDLTLVLQRALEDHDELSEKNLVDKVEYLMLRIQNDEYNSLKKALKTALKE